jgi:N-alpha-acetyltransferase 40
MTGKFCPGILQATSSDFPFPFDQNSRIEYKSAHDILQQNLFSLIFRIFESNMKSMYETTIGWDPVEKQNEMCESEARYLIVREENSPSSSEIIGFCHFRFDMEDDVSVVYCYEVQVIQQKRGHSLGKHLMNTLERFALYFGLEAVFLTCFKINRLALDFYYHLG